MTCEGAGELEDVGQVLVQLLPTASFHQHPSSSSSSSLSPLPSFCSTLAAVFPPLFHLSGPALSCSLELVRALAHALQGWTATEGYLDVGLIMSSRVFLLVGLGLLNEVGVGVDEHLDLNTAQLFLPAQPWDKLMSEARRRLWQATKACSSCSTRR